MQLVDHGMGGSLGSRAQVQHRDDLGQRIEGQPEPQGVRPIAEPTPQFVKLELREMEPSEEAVVQRRAVRAGPRQPGGDGRVAMAEHPHGSRHTQPFRQPVSTSVTRCDAVLSWYSGVSWRALKVVRHAWQRNV
jgi:hypothetical protein